MKLLFTKLILILILLQSCGSSSQKESVSGYDFAIKMADSEMIHFPESWTVDFNTRLTWNYTQGLIAFSMIKIWEESENKAYYDYAKSYADKFIGTDGTISYFVLEDYNIDAVNSGKFLFDLFKNTNDERYLKAVSQLRDQLKTHPRTSEGGFWHKKRYPHQMWLDGLYMGAPFYAQYALEMNQPELFDDVVKQFQLVHKYTYNPETGLNYHGWDESREQAWSDSITGCSPHYWGRAMGWYAMALTDVLDFIPEKHAGRIKIIEILNQVAAGIKKYQDDETGLWYQVLDQGSREGNYLEATASSMFTYSLLKAIRKGYISDDYKEVAKKAYLGIVENLIKQNSDGTLSLIKCCSVAGLGGDPYRDGSYEYYIKEPVRDNDPKGVGPFIMASLEYSKIY